MPSGYTVRQYYSHFTDNIGPGPGWDIFNDGETKKELIEKYEIKLDKPYYFLEPGDLPDIPHYTWQRVEE